jgi:ABC-type phosphate transport system substrate-binding protein
MNRVLASIIVCAGLIALAPASAVAQQASTRAYRVIVNPENPVGVISATELSQLFLRKQQAWRHNGRQILPVELTEGTAARDAFVREIHHKDESALKSYWRQMIFSGKAVPPPTEQSDAAVLDYVRRYPNAIGYVSAAATLPADVKLVTITN